MQYLKRGHEAMHETVLYVVTCKPAVCNSPSVGL